MNSKLKALFVVTAPVMLIAFTNCSDDTPSVSDDEGVIVAPSALPTSKPSSTSVSGCQPNNASPYSVLCSNAVPSAIVPVIFACNVTPSGVVALKDATTVTLALYKIDDPNSVQRESTAACSLQNALIQSDLLNKKIVDFDKVYAGCLAANAAFDESALYEIDVIAANASGSNVVNGFATLGNGGQYIQKLNGFQFGLAPWGLYPVVSPEITNVGDSITIEDYRSSTLQSGASFSCPDEV